VHGHFSIEGFNAKDIAEWDKKKAIFQPPTGYLSVGKICMD